MAKGVNFIVFRKCVCRSFPRKSIVLLIIFLFSFCALMGYVSVSKARSAVKYWAIEIQNATNNVPDLSAVTEVSTESQRYFQLVNRGTNVQVGDMQIHLTTAVHYDHYPYADSFNVLLNGWARHDIDMNFTCCLLTSLDDDKTSALEVPSEVYNVYDQYGYWIVDMQSAEFSCSLPPKNNLPTESNSQPFRYVTFGEKNCSMPSRTVLEIKYPPKVDNSVVICLKISYGDLILEEMIEWFEYVRLVGVTRVVTFLSDDLSPGARDIFMYYNTTGFLDASPIDPAVSTYGSKRGFRRPRDEFQAFVDEVMACNDCKHRYSGHDFIIIQDMDEYIVPKLPHQTLFSLLQFVSRKHHRVAGFSFGAHVSAKEWNETRSSPLHLMRKIHRTAFPNFSGAGKDSRWAFMPQRVFYVRNNKAYPRMGYTWINVPQKLFILQHRRKCKITWPGCKNLSTEAMVEDTDILRFEARLIGAIKNLPLERILLGIEHKDYINGIRNWEDSQEKQP